MNPRRIAASLLGLLSFYGAAAMVLLAYAAPVFQAQTSAVIVPRVPTSRLEAYQYDLISRGVIPASYGAILAEPATKTLAGDRLGLSRQAERSVEIDIGVSSRTAVLTVSASSPTAELSETMAQAVLDEGARLINSFDGLYVLRIVREARGTATPSMQLQRQLFAPALLAPIAALMAAGRLHRLTTRTRTPAQ